MAQNKETKNEKVIAFAVDICIICVICEFMLLPLRQAKFNP
jgi:hypothetical protein